MIQNLNQQNRQNSTDGTPRSTEFSSWLGTILTGIILTVAIRNLSINTRTLEISMQNLQNTLNSAENTKTMISELQKINNTLERM